MAQSHEDSVSATLGQMLLKGYKMLAESCPKCSMVLMQDKRGQVICVNCNANAPATHPESLVSTSDSRSGHRSPRHGYSERYPYPNENQNQHSGGEIGPETLPETAVYASQVLLKEIKFASDRLESSQNLPGEDFHGRLSQIKYIRECAETIKVLQQIRM